MKKHSILLSLALVLVACGPAKDVEVGPYTVSVIGKNVYHIQDYNHENPAGEEFDADGKLTHFNNCSDIYLVVGEQEALLIDLSNPIDWADNAAESLRALVAERVAGKPLTITFTHNHGDHTGMLPAFLEEDVRFALPERDFRRLAERFPADKYRFINEGEIFDLGGYQVEAIAVPGHTDGSTVYLLKGQDLLFTGDAIGSGHGVWIFNENGFNQYVSAVPHLIAALEERGVNPDKLQVYGGHYWQKDWLKLPKGRELGMDYIRDMKAVLDEMEAGKAATEPSNLGRPNLDTYFRHGNAIVTWNAAGAEKYAHQYPETFVYRDENIVFRQIDEHTWEGNGHLVYNESVYVIEGEDKALVIDAGTEMPHLSKAVATQGRRDPDRQAPHARAHPRPWRPCGRGHLLPGGLDTPGRYVHDQQRRPRVWDENQPPVRRRGHRPGRAADRGAPHPGPYLRLRHFLRQGASLRLQRRRLRFHEPAALRRPVQHAHRDHVPHGGLHAEERHREALSRPLSRRQLGDAPARAGREEDVGRGPEIYIRYNDPEALK